MALGNLPFPSYAVCLWASLEVAFGGRFCREAYGLPVDEEHSLPCVLEFLSGLSPTTNHCEIIETRWDKRYTEVAQGDQKG